MEVRKYFFKWQNEKSLINFLKVEIDSILAGRHPFNEMEKKYLSPEKS
jgi:hypothetical protein